MYKQVRAKIRDCVCVCVCVYVCVLEQAREGLGHPAWLGRPWPRLLAHLRPKPGSIPGGLGGGSCQSQFHHLGTNLPLPPRSFSSPHLTRDPRERGFPLPKPSPLSATVGSRAPAHRGMQASPHPPLGGLPGLVPPPWARTSSASQAPEPGSLQKGNTLLLWSGIISQMLLGLSRRPDCSFAGVGMGRRG